MKRDDAGKTGEQKAGSGAVHLDARRLAQILGIGERAVRKQAQKHDWKIIPVMGKGGERYEYLISTIHDVELRAKVFRALGLQEEFALAVRLGWKPEQITAGSQAWDQADERQRELAKFRLDVLCRLDDDLKSGKGSRTKLVKRFANRFRQRSIPGLYPRIYSRIRSVSPSTLYEWRKNLLEKGPAGLISSHGSNRGEQKIPPEQYAHIVGTRANNPRCGATRITKGLKKRFADEAMSRATVQRCIDTLKARDPAVFTFFDSPDRYKATHQLALGNASEKAQYFLHYGEMDSTPTDVVCDDGERYTIIGFIDIFSRKCKFQVTKTSNRWGIAALLRRVIWEWGLPEHIVMDHGKDYESKQIREALLVLRIETPWIPPFDPKSKPHIERVFRTLAHGLEEYLPGYIGHNREERRAIESRRSFADRLCKRGDPIETGLSWQALQETIDRWTEDVYHQRLHTMIGMTPSARAASTPHRPTRIPDIRALDLLLAEGGVRTVGKKGLRYGGGQYWADDLIPYMGREVIVRVDMRDAGRLVCIDPQSRAFICEALDMATSGITVADKIRARKLADKRVREKVCALKKLAEEAYTDPVAEEMAAVRGERAVIRNLHVGDPVADNPFVDAALAAAEAADQRPARPDKATVEAVFEGDLPLDVLPAAWQPEAFKVRARREADLALEANPKVARFPKQLIDVPDRDTPEPRYFQDALEKFHYLQEQQRKRALTDAEEDWLRREVEEWRTYAEMFVETWPRGDQVWLARTAPYIFGEYADTEPDCDSL